VILTATGHRPAKLGGYGEDIRERLVGLANDSLGRLAPQRVITGVALGWDQAVAEAAILRGLPFTAAIPFEGQEKVWPAASQQRYKEILRKAAEVTYVSPPGYAGWKMMERNKWMVDRADVVLALWDGSSGGTANAVHYAESRGRKVVNVWRELEGGVGWWKVRS
jgi:uncharacterized phage-like protein YoqJ